ncbi:MAG: hypothetical protein RIS17_1728, partial [Pseudomonadota bacterium]
ASDPAFRADIAEIAIDGGEGRLDEIMACLSRHGDALADLRVEGVEPLLRRGLGLADDDSEAKALASAIAGLPWAKLRDFACVMGQQSGARAIDIGKKLAAYDMTSDKVAAFDDLWSVFFKADGDPRAADWMVPKALAQWHPLCTEMQDHLRAIRAIRERWQILAFAGRHLRVAVRLAQDWRAAKHRAGVIDYDDMIAAAARLLSEDGAADWVRFKLDSRIDHVLVDEAQDTNFLQWEVIRALTLEFFSGAGQRDLFRSLFVVGDFKQSIFGFQGADPTIYADRKQDFWQLCEAEPERWIEQPLTVNFRSVPTILNVVDRVIDHVGGDQFDPQGVERHIAHKAGRGIVTLWPPILPPDGATDDDGDDNGGDNGGDDPDAPPLALDIAMARSIAATIAGWMRPETRLRLPASGKLVMPQDILVLVRRRGGLMNALVAALHEAGVPVAGADRLNLAEPLAVADLLALVEFACQPGDDLALASLLVSPFCGLNHDALTAVAAERKGGLWAAVQASDDPALAAPRAWLAEVLRLAADVSPYRFLETILSGPLAGRRKLLARLGEEARDAIETVLDQALACEAAGAASLQAFLAWMAAGDLEVKRDPEAAIDAVRLMTVHGAKGLQAPIVIMADACSVPRRETGAIVHAIGNGPELPLWLPPGLAEPPAWLADAIADREGRAAREYRRLLYVALTRAEEMLFIGGASKPGKEWDVHPQSWYALVEAALTDAGLEEISELSWPAPSRVLASGPPAEVKPSDIMPAKSLLSTDQWWLRDAPAEARPPRPLAPSSLGSDTVADPPPSAARQAAARRGTALHRLFETLPGIDGNARRRVALAWCEFNVPDLDGPELAETVLAVLEDPAFAPVFAPDALTEAPVAAVVGEAVIAGSIDRLLVSETDVLAVDFKTGSRVPPDLAAVPPAHLAQMGAYAAALARVFPGRQVRAGLLYTAGPRLIEVPAAVLAQWQPGSALQSGKAAPI